VGQAVVLLEVAILSTNHAAVTVKAVVSCTYVDAVALGGRMPETYRADAKLTSSTLRA
jgi:hypothetical protein